MLAFLPVSCCHAALMASSAFFRLAAANTISSPVGACARAADGHQAKSAATVTARALAKRGGLAVILFPSPDGRDSIGAIDRYNTTISRYIPSTILTPLHSALSLFSVPSAPSLLP